jgi:hypothetical protein
VGACCSLIRVALPAITANDRCSLPPQQTESAREAGPEAFQQHLAACVHHASAVLQGADLAGWHWLQCEACQKWRLVSGVCVRREGADKGGPAEIEGPHLNSVPHHCIPTLCALRACAWTTHTHTHMHRHLLLRGRLHRPRHPLLLLPQHRPGGRAGLRGAGRLGGSCGTAGGRLSGADHGRRVRGTMAAAECHQGSGFSRTRGRCNTRLANVPQCVLGCVCKSMLAMKLSYRPERHISAHSDTSGASAATLPQLGASIRAPTQGRAWMPLLPLTQHETEPGCKTGACALASARRTHRQGAGQKQAARFVCWLVLPGCQ